MGKYVNIFLDILSQFQQFSLFMVFAEQADKGLIVLFLFHITVQIIFCTYLHFGAPWGHITFNNVITWFMNSRDRTNIVFLYIFKLGLEHVEHVQLFQTKFYTHLCFLPCFLHSPPILSPLTSYPDDV
jgi:hypothetical protein